MFLCEAYIVYVIDITDNNAHKFLSTIFAFKYDDIDPPEKLIYLHPANHV